MGNHAAVYPSRTRGSMGNHAAVYPGSTRGSMGNHAALYPGRCRRSTRGSMGNHAAVPPGRAFEGEPQLLKSKARNNTCSMPSPLSSHVSSGSSSSRELAAVIELTWLFSCSSEEIGKEIGAGAALSDSHGGAVRAFGGEEEEQMAYSRGREREVLMVQDEDRRVKLSCRDNTHAKTKAHNRRTELHVLLACTRPNMEPGVSLV